MRPVLSHCRSFFGPQSFLALLILALIGLAGCATKPSANDPDALADYQQTNDPLEPTNRVFYAINNGLDTVILRPAALAESGARIVALPWASAWMAISVAWPRPPIETRFLTPGSTSTVTEPYRGCAGPARE